MLPVVFSGAMLLDTLLPDIPLPDIAFQGKGQSSVISFSKKAHAAAYKIATISPDGLDWVEKLRAAIAEIGRQTEGRVQFKIYPGGIQGDDATVLRKMRIGQLHGGVLTAGALTRFYPDLQVYNLPMQFRNYDEVDHVRARMDDMIAAGLKQAGLETFTFIETGFAYLMTREPVRTVADLRSLKAWIPDNDPIAAELVRTFGVSPIPLAITDVLAGLQTGLIDAVMAPPTAVLVLQWHNHVRYMTDIPILYIYSTLAMKEEAFRAMSAEDQQTARAILDAVFAEVGRDTRVDNEKALAAIQAVGIQKIEVSGAQFAEWNRVADRSIEALLRSGEISRESVNRYRAILRQYRESASE